MPAEYTYDYAIIRVVPRVERGERINAGADAAAPFTYREAYVRYLLARLAAPEAFVEEAIRAHAALV